MNFCIRRRQGFLAAVAAAMPRTLHAQSAWPGQRPIRLLVPFAAGGPMDAVARLLAPSVGELLGQQIVVENRTGGTGIVCLTETARSAPDGYTLMITGASWPVTMLLNRDLPFRMEDFAPLSRLTVAPFVMVVPSTLPVRSLAEFITEAKKRPGDWSYGTSGIGTTLHMAMEMLKLRAGIDLVHVPYRGDAPAITDLLAGRLQAMFPTLSTAGPYLQDNRLRALAVGYTQRVDSLPEVPTLTELGYGDVPASADFGVACAAGVPVPIRTKVSEAFRLAVRQPEAVRRLHGMGILVVGSTATGFATMLADESARYAEVIRAANITLN